MTTTASIAELQQAGVTLQAGEAVAVAQQLIQTLRRYHDAGALQPPYGPPTAANVILNDDGTVSCAACGTTPAISEIAIFLDALLPPGSTRVPGGLRYVIARGLLEVDVAPFDSLDEFSEALKRHESGPRAEAVLRLLRRAQAVRAFAPGGRTDRRRAHTTELRRALREADVQLYAHRMAAEMPGSSPASHFNQSASEGRRLGSPAGRPRTVAAVAVCLGSGLMLVATGEFMHGRPATTPVAAPLVAMPRNAAPRNPAPAPLTAIRTAETGAMSLVAFPAPRPAVRDAAPRRVDREIRPRAFKTSAAAPAAASNPARSVRLVPSTPGDFGRPYRTSVESPARGSEAAVRTTRSPRTSSHGILDHLRFRWLRNAFSTSADAL